MPSPIVLLLPLALALSLPPPSLSLPLLEGDQQALGAIWAAAGKAVEPVLDGCSWKGVACSESIDSPVHLRVIILKIDLELDQESVGVLATEIGRLTQLYNLYLNTKINPRNISKPEGALPSEIGRLTRLESFESYALSGSLPTELGDLTSLKSMTITLSPHLTGTIPTELGRLTALTSLFIDQTSLSPLSARSARSDKIEPRLSGTIPTELGRLSALASLRIEQTRLEGSIPSEIGMIDNSGLCGTIPSELGRLGNLEWLDLFNNELSGTIPAELGLLTEEAGGKLDCGVKFNPLTDPEGAAPGCVILHRQSTTRLIWVVWATSALSICVLVYLEQVKTAGLLAGYLAAILFTCYLK